jgi:hypothetical protein
MSPVPYETWIVQLIMVARTGIHEAATCCHGCVPDAGATVVTSCHISSIQLRLDPQFITVLFRLIYDTVSTAEVINVQSGKMGRRMLNREEYGGNKS